MGLFLTQLALKVNSRNKVIDAIIEVMKSKGLSLESKKKASDATGLDNQFDVIGAKKGWVQIFCPEVQDDTIPKELSKKLDVPIFQFHIHDGDFWMYQLFVSGELKDKHNPIPDYWEKISEAEKEKWKGNPKVLSDIFGVDVSKVEPYIIFWNENKKKSNCKAFPSDEQIIANEWAMIDFQKKFGIEYPDFENPNTLDIIRLTFKSTKLKKIKDFLRLK
ncbi:hypothetical protein HYS31_07805 [Candidatus Woesearchaeota archaeon]|nr:hypothetical protein [Candidatus Woesearchaeota archaeon]